MRHGYWACTGEGSFPGEAGESRLIGEMGGSINRDLMVADFDLWCESVAPS